MVPQYRDLFTLLEVAVLAGFLANLNEINEPASYLASETLSASGAVLPSLSLIYERMSYAQAIQALIYKFAVGKK